MPVSINSRLGRYEILSRIGAGGMGEVYRARDTKLGRDVAIKVLPEAFVRDRERMARFELEAKFLAALNHPNIAAIYGVEDAGSTDALVMELAEGSTLADRIASGPIPVAEALPIARQIADALEYAHEHALVHRDLKPANIKISRDGCVKILDFGLAKAVEGEESASDIADSPTISQRATEAGVLLGTVAYMSPEQVKAKPVDRRADIWAFGCVLYEMFTGNKAFAADTVTETLAAVLHNDPDWSQLPTETPTRIRVLLQRCLQKDPKQRLRDIGDARISLDEVLSGAPDPALVAAAQDASARWRRALPWAIATLLFVTSAWLAFARFRQKPSAPAESMRFQIPLPEKTTFVSGLALSPDGRHLAFATLAQDGSTQVWLRDLDSLESRPLADTGGSGPFPFWSPDIHSGAGPFPFWSPDSRSVAFWSRGKLKRVDISGGVPQVICSTGDFFGGAWSPDGVIVFGSDKGLMKVSAAGGEPSILIKVRHSLSPWLGAPRFLPDGRHFLYNARTPSGLPTYVGSLDAGGEQPSSNPLVVGRSAYVPASGAGPGSILFIRPDRTLVAQPFDASRLELKGEPNPVVEGVNRFSISPNGVLAYAGGSAYPFQLTWFDRQGKVLGTVGEPGIMPSFAISPDGRTVAVARPDGSGRFDLWLYDLEHSARTRFTLDGTINLFPVWSPDGSRIAFLSGRQAPAAVYEKPVNGVGQKEALKVPSSNSVFQPLDWSRDGRYLIEELNGDTYSIWTLPLSPGQSGGEQKPIPLVNEGFNATKAKLSPDGKWIAYDSDETGRDEIFVRTFPEPGGKWQVSTNGGTHPVWSRDGKELYFIASDGNLMEADVKSRSDGSFGAGVAKVLFNPRVRVTRFDDVFDVAKDGRFLIPANTQQPAPPITVVVNWRAQGSR